MEREHVAWLLPALTQFEGNEGTNSTIITLQDPESPNKKHRRLKIYSDSNYKDLRISAGLSSSEVQSSLRLNPTLKESAGTGTLLVYTGDQRFVLKALGKEEYEQLQRMGEAYRLYMEAHQESVLVKLQGVYKIKVYGRYRKTKLWCLLMDNIFYSPSLIESRFDLKGSEFGRSSENAELGLDLDFIESGLSMCLGALRTPFLSQLSLDIAFLQTQSLFDYSLLVGISAQQQGMRSEGRRYCWEGEQDRVYFIAVIDLASSYSPSRQLETAAKSLLFGQTISCVPPEQYAERFLSAMSRLVV
jgi:hypothetical protein